MIRQAKETEYDEIWSFISRDFARNYFIALGLLQNSFQTIYLDKEDCIRGALFVRKSGNLQFSGQHCDFQGFSEIIKSLDFKYLISPKSYCKSLTGIELVKEGAFIDVLESCAYHPIESKAVPLLPSDMMLVERLYSKVFSGYPKSDYMKSKLREGRGIGYCIKEKEIISVAQTDFYNIIVGVATDPMARNRGLATECLHAVVQKAFEKEDMLYLQYDNMKAGKIYRDLGFKNIDQVCHYRGE